MAYTNIDDPSAHFQTKLYTGTGNSLALTNDGNSDLKPDFAWIKYLASPLTAPLAAMPVKKCSFFWGFCRL